MTARFPNDPAEATNFAHGLIAQISYRFNRAGGLFDRLDAAIGAGERITTESLSSLHLFNDATVLRQMADALDERREALTGRAPRLRLVAAE
jgi:hypothetical protein